MNRHVQKHPDVGVAYKFPQHKHGCEKQLARIYHECSASRSRWYDIVDENNPFEEFYIFPRY